MPMKRVAIALAIGVALILAVLVGRPTWNDADPQNAQAGNSLAPSRQESPAPAASGAPDQHPYGSPPADRVQAAAQERVRSAQPEAQAPQSYVGPDGKTHEIVYNQGLTLSDQERALLKKELLEDMRQHPFAFSKIYGMTEEDVKAVLAGTKPFPEALLYQ